MDNFNWVREYNKLLETLNEKDSYFSGGRFIGVIREFDPYFPDYNQFIEHRRQKDLSTSRKNYFYDILMSFKEDLRKSIIDRLYVVAKEKTELGNWPISKDTDAKDHNIGNPDGHYDMGSNSNGSDSKNNSWYGDEKEDRTLSSGNSLNETKEDISIREDEKVSTEIIENPIVFISYSWDNEDHKSWILNLSKRLFDNGVQVILDRYELKPGANMIHFMESSIPKADKVLIVFTPNYKLKAEKRQGGVGFEYSILNTELYHQITTNKKFIPILKDGNYKESIPSFIQQFISIDMRDITTYEDRLNELLLAIYDKPLIEKPALGKRLF